MIRIEKIGASPTELPPAWISRVIGTTTALGNYDKIRKMLGEPVPIAVDPNHLPPKVKEFFKKNGKLSRLARRLKAVTKRGVKDIIPAKNTIAAVDEHDNLYVGVDFLAEYGNDEDLLAAVLAHEWGHLTSEVHKNINPDNFTLNDLLDIRREEEAFADAFAGRILFLLGYKPDSAITFFEKLERSSKLPTVKYHNSATRIEILKQSYKAMESAFETAQKIFIESGLKFGKVLGDG